MNDNDKSNLNFLICLSEDGLRLWAAQASEDDMDYAAELLRECRKTLESASDFIDLMPESVAEANSVLSKFRLSK